MLTDDDVITHLRDSFAGTVADVLPDPELHSRVWQEHRRSVRRKRLLAPGVLAVVGLTLVSAYATRAPGDRGVENVLLASPSPQPEVPGPTVKLFDYAFTLPSGFVASPVRYFDLSKAQPPQPVHGETAFFEARKGDQQLGITIYRGPIADAEATVRAPNPDSVRTRTVAGFEATTDTFSATRPECVTKVNGQTTVRVTETGPCSKQGSETRLFTAPHELVWVTSEEVPLATVDAVLESGLRP